MEANKEINREWMESMKAARYTAASGDTTSESSEAGSNANTNVSHIPNNHSFGNQSRNFRIQQIEQKKGFLADQKQKLTGLLDDYHEKRKAGANAATLEHIKDVSREVRVYIGDLEASIAEIEDEIRTRYNSKKNKEFNNMVKGLSNKKIES